MTDRTLARLSIVAGFAAIILLTVTSVANADIRDWSPIINETECTITGSGSATTVHVGGQQVATLDKGDTWTDDGPVSGEVRVWLKRDLFDSATFDFDCNEGSPPSSTTTTTSTPTTTTNSPITTSTAPPSSSTTTEATTTTTTPEGPGSTTTTTPQTATTTPGESTSTTTTPGGSTSVPPSTTTDCGPDTLPCTGPTTDPYAWTVAGVALLVLGAGMLRAATVTRREKP